MTDGWTAQFARSFDLYLEYYPTQFTQMDWSTPLGMVGTAIVACVLLERFAPRLRDWGPASRPGFKLDLFYVVWMELLVLPLGLYAFLVASETSARASLRAIGLPDPLPWTPDLLPGPLGVLLAFLLLDLAEWGAHYALHRVPLLWRIHKIHHAPRTLGFATTRRFHFLEHLVFRAFVFVPMALLGVSLEAYAAVVWATGFLAFLSHCNVRLPWGPLARWIITPDTHYWHHARNVPKPYGVNFASSLCLWDHLFGTFHLTEEQPELGIHHDDVPPGFLGQLAYPLLAAVRADPGPSFVDAPAAPAPSRRAARPRPRRRRRKRR